MRTRPQYPTGKSLATRNPDRGPYWWLLWTSVDGLKLLPNVPERDVHTLTNDVETFVIADDPGMSRFVPDRAPSPWAGTSFGDDRWWPMPTPPEPKR